MHLLDDSRIYDHDPRGMRHLIAQLPRQAAEAWSAALAWDSSNLPREPKRVIVLGVGGSAIGADVVSALASRSNGSHVEVVRDYTVPVHDERTLIVACSFSGETEEVLHALSTARSGPGNCVAITSGGSLARTAAELDIPCFSYDFDGPPRAAFGYALFPLLAILGKLDALSIDERGVEEAMGALMTGAEQWGTEVPQADNRAKQIASGLRDRMVLIVGPDLLTVTARRWAGQIAESAKQWATHAELPELNHNLIVGLQRPRAVADHLSAVLLDSFLVHPRNRLRVRLTAEAFNAAQIPTDLIEIEGSSPLAVMLTGCYLGDWVSFYLAMLNGVDPMPTPPLDLLKSRLRATPE